MISIEVLDVVLNFTGMKIRTSC